MVKFVFISASMYLICAHIFGFTTAFQFALHPIVTCYAFLLKKFSSFSVSLSLLVTLCRCVVRFPMKCETQYSMQLKPNKDSIVISLTIVNNISSRESNIFPTTQFYALHHTMEKSNRFYSYQ